MLLHKINVQALSLCVCLFGIILHTNTVWRYRLVVRDEPRIMGVPAPFMYCAVSFSLIAFFLIWFIKATQNHDTARPVRKGRIRGAMPPWQECILCSFGVLVGTIATSLFINSRLDKSAARTYQPKITKMYTKRGPEGRREGRLSGYIRLADWKQMQSEIDLEVSDEIFETYKTGEKINITTKSGFLGYEWIVSLN